MQTFYFTEVEGGIRVRSRAEGEGGTVGDLNDLLPTDDTFFGLPYAWVLERARTTGSATMAEIEAAAHG